MARIRTVKPELFRHEELYELEISTGLPIRLSFIALFTACDREGRFKWRPRQLKLDCLPYDEIDFSRVLHALMSRGFIKKYTILGVDYGCIPSFKCHQVINNRETNSTIPESQEFHDFPDEKAVDPVNLAPKEDVNPKDSRVIHASFTRHGNAQGEGKGREGKRKGKEGDYCPDPNASGPDCGDEKIISLPLNKKGTFHDVVKKDLLIFEELYQAVDVTQELRKMLGWLNANPSRRKTKTGINKFINGWLSREQDSSKQKSPASGDNRKPGFNKQPMQRPDYSKPVRGVDAIDSTCKVIIHE